ncbi:YsnF/AvaK domain-containing protein [Sorangium sp. So ce260]|uniref:YsnF/AvaK domain-containing protein n=1 Tax=Sorangium sp. So ce260 TaxID=3133291 RepID=UPI003F611790
MVKQHEIARGMVVRSSDGEKLGKVTRLDVDTFEIEKGFFFPEEYAVRYDEVIGIRDGDIILTHARDQLAGGRDQGRETEGTIAAGGEIRVPLVEEEITAGTTVQEVGRVQIRKEVVTEEKQVTVPVAREVVHVERVPASGERPIASGTTIEEGSISIPVREEQVEISKRPVVKEELRISKEVVHEQAQARATVRREEPEVRTEGTVRREDTQDETPATTPEQMPPERATGTGGRRR